MNGTQDEEEEDYMSEAFLNNLVQENAGTKASMTYSEKRRQKELEHLANLPKPLHVREKEAREMGLEKEIGEENKGMAMLLKMGFKKGGTLGAKPSAESSSDSMPVATSTPEMSKKDNMGHADALRAPLAIQIKQGRGGLGMDSARKRQAEEELQRQVDEAHRTFDQDYRGQKRNQFDQEKRNRQLGAARGICMQMDAKKAEGHPDQPQPSSNESLSRSNAFWWISDSVPADILGTRMMGPSAEVMLSEQGHIDRGAVNQRSFDHSDDEDGNLEHKKDKRIKLNPLSSTEIFEDVAQDEEPAKWGERPEFAQLEVPEKLEKVVQYLRDEHYYCFWCSAQYDGPDDLQENCPGKSEDDH